MIFHVIESMVIPKGNKCKVVKKVQNYKVVILQKVQKGLKECKELVPKLFGKF